MEMKAINMFILMHKRDSMGLTGKQVITPNHINICKVAFTPSPNEIAKDVSILKAALEADALLSGAIRYEGEMLDPQCLENLYKIF